MENTNTKLLLHSKELGVYLGSCMGLGFWSELDPAGQTEAVTFDSKAIAEEFMNTWDEEVTDVTFLPITTNDLHVSMDDCVRAGVKPWDDS